MTCVTLDQNEFSDRLHEASTHFLDNRQASLELLGKEKSVIVYSFGTKGSDLARQFRSAGIECFVFDNAKEAVEKAAAEGFKTTSNLALDLPLIVAAGQNQLSILSGLTRPAYSLAEGLYAFDLINAYGKARLFTEMLPMRVDELFLVYRRLDPICREDFLNVLLYRASLDVRHIASTRKPVSQMWTPPPAISSIHSFCDVGAYDGDTLAGMKAIFPGLESTLAVEPNPEMVSSIGAVAKRNGLSNQVFVGAAWSHKTKLNCYVLPNGMMAVTEDATGAIDADALDNITSLQHFDYVKFDVEGAEAPALEGAKSLLRGSRCIAIASYHLPGDLVDIPNHVGAILGSDWESEWRCAFHHYSECFDDSIFYFYREKE